ncbi:DUF1287 domain-containing protein [Alisedimentitalea sp. MJ-SS2]|uniref:DUF1287 domain-containing protein n=1 Tax=Aliisedimentitalea sp. MJ-SS2 TaxID=3049795 RepID=UPI002912C047|nr:DUF1287 domain-containing protein [Alisedimentitalea sp. MJ-SS2]MDU8928096.1 DUF1287 domain-containing protein [Alisedimentitalea sp. MJ-SS2]
MRTLVLILAFTAVIFTAAIGLAKPHHWNIARAYLSDLVPATAITPAPEPLPSSDWSRALITSARSQIGITTIYDGAYQSLSYPGGDVPRERGVCTDVLIRALRDAHGIDLQKLVHEDMRAAFSRYPAIWGLQRPDRNIDHRRVPNLRRYFKRGGMALPMPDEQTIFLPGDIVTWTLGRGLPHIGIVSDQLVPGTERPMIIHNVGAGARLEDFLLRYPMTGHYRLDGKL